MLEDSSPTAYVYEDAATVLSALGFEVAPHGGGSHRKWRRRLANGNIVVIGLVQTGGTLRPYLVRQMISQLRDHGIVPDHQEHP
jgi:hypothetical protein